MRVLLLADPSSAHTIKWACSLADVGLEIGIFGLTEPEPTTYQAYSNISLFSAGFTTTMTRSPLANPAKIQYLRALPRLKVVIRRFQPDILHAHFASSYGLFGALSGFHPYVLSVWGADVFDFPRKSLLHRALIKYNLGRADKILSTSHVMAVESQRYTAKPIEITPFGIDTEMFQPLPVKSPFDANDIVIGTVKTLEAKYGIDDLIRAFSLAVERNPNLPLRLLIVGEGSLRGSLEQLAQSLGVGRLTVFTGRMPYEQVPGYHNMMTIFVALSTLDSESFGVAAIEASACEKPVVVSNIGGLPEVVEDQITGFVVPPHNPARAAEMIEKLVMDQELRAKMGKAGRRRVQELYDWDHCVKQMISIYQHLFRSYAVKRQTHPE